jgi:hypothetical protein
MRKLAAAGLNPIFPVIVGVVVIVVIGVKVTVA